MKNKFVLLTVPLILFAAVLGCNSFNPLESSSDAPPNANSKKPDAGNQTLTNQAIETTVGGTTTGVAECDELMNALSDQSKNQNDDFVSKAAREFALNRIRDGVKKSIEENQNDKVALARNCADFKRQLDKFKAEESQKTDNKEQ